jgi:hypothetical protein
MWTIEKSYFRRRRNKPSGLLPPDPCGYWHMAPPEEGARPPQRLYDKSEHTNRQFRHLSTLASARCSQLDTWVGNMATALASDIIGALTYFGPKVAIIICWPCTPTPNVATFIDVKKGARTFRRRPNPNVVSSLVSASVRPVGGF